MKTPEDIKKALECCSDADGFDGDCIKCPYKGEQWCGDKSKIDALTYIHQLENHIGGLTEKVEQLEATHPKLGKKELFKNVSCKGVCERS